MSPLPVDLGDGAILRRLVLDDLEDLWAVVERERERIGAWMPWVALTPTIDDERRGSSPSVRTSAPSRAAGCSSTAGMWGPSV